MRKTKRRFIFIDWQNVSKC